MAALSVNGVILNYEKTGEGRPLLMIHGNGEDHTIFRESAALLSKHFACYLIDSRGFGASSPVTEYHYRDMAQDMVCFMNELDLKNVAFYGFSDGGIIGLMAAAMTDRITDLIVSGANTNPKGLVPWISLVIWATYLRKRDPKWGLMVKEPHITKEELSKIRCRTLVLAGEFDLILYPHTKAIARNIKNSRMRILRGEGHGSYIVNSEKLGVLLLKWLK